MALNLITKHKLKKMTASQLMTTAAIGIDKAQLLSGEVTERVSLTMEEIDQRLREIQEQRNILKQAENIAFRKRKEGKS